MKPRTSRIIGAAVMLAFLPAFEILFHRLDELPENFPATIEQRRLYFLLGMLQGGMFIIQGVILLMTGAPTRVASKWLFGFTLIVGLHSILVAVLLAYRHMSGQ